MMYHLQAEATICNGFLNGIKAVLGNNTASSQISESVSNCQIYPTG